MLLGDLISYLETLAPESRYSTYYQYVLWTALIIRYQISDIPRNAKVRVNRPCSLMQLIHVGVISAMKPYAV